MMAMLAIATRSLSRELASNARPNAPYRIPPPCISRPTADRAARPIVEAAG